jgi:phosphatidylglycerophosphate synthase
MLTIPSDITRIIAVVIFFTKGILDWSDGHLARITGQTSLTGHILDTHGAHINSLCFQIGIGFYVAQKADMMIFYYLIPLIPFLYAANLAYFSTGVWREFDVIKDQIAKCADKNMCQPLALEGRQLSKIKNSRLKYYILNIFDDRARSVDFICLLILIEIYTPYFVTWVIFSVLLLKQFLIFCGSYYVVVKHKLAEVEINDMILKISEYTNSGKSNERN